MSTHEHEHDHDHDHDIDPNTFSDRMEVQIKKQEDAKHSGRIVARAEEMQWGETKMGSLSLRISPMAGFPINTMHAHMDRIAPGASTGLHRHSSEAIVLVIEGEGYTTIDGVRYDWEKGDCFVVPVGTWHQYFNKSDVDPVIYYAVSNWPLTVDTGHSYLEYAVVNDRYRPSEFAVAETPATKPTSGGDYVPSELTSKEVTSEK